MILDSALTGGIRQAELTGQEQYNAFVEERYYVKNKLQLFSKPPPTELPKSNYNYLLLKMIVLSFNG